MADLIWTAVSAKVRFLQEDSFSFMTLKAMGAQEPFSMKATVRFWKFRSVRWSMNSRMKG